MSRYKKQPSIEQKIITGIGKALWVVVSFPFKKKKSGDVADRWKEVQELMAKNDMHAWTMAIMKADSILDSVIKKRVSGETMGERLKNIEGKISRDALQSAWDAHKVRNQIAHGDSDISRTQAQTTIANFRKVLNEMGEM
ncbi:hypothetical protein COZ61_00965 [Candidatus Berkelbacteria bacterium CG_4_8_14_3_um_filter_33_6]|uniref:RiboL-PSP-HEPN domain-containing protein n=1 Tax=Candidatus Berkelbacteria bacterium CG_4_10_14_0_2_um_filter_35_9_33_12 TaxID=1974499 RepID=A0A2M7W4D9_9BACT|nr:MAG: hypothetical protein COX10_00930 [Candidatus Berkelbacteria bacterium CG23_combo_of_CG06-09_8_20_14_all_33_15]PIX31207.1 MAG: hypothetical protein COZ61_00965 [Candidatus Berkelbacteria bacterium CG_4_8_14_3_um_filter_33_6]PIZ28209.1 MAG: hypothetical protein COY43_01735 [Candidatus Berkelbacteria bacterium CG_4_10_14_0_8_um_filter_35_9_33_8]PJA20636.1 MAG: hypothetical protein COX60_01140 [Candidatus Berkelbacteria bacterium CG_4_10_14_0_2_um_filter_35_9_33_12]PJB52024.1 MAG: hypotheti